MNKKQKTAKTITKRYENLDFDFEIDEKKIYTIIQEFQKSLTEKEIQAPYYKDWSNDRLGELSIIMFQSLVSSIGDIEKASIKSMSMLCHLIEENNMNKLDISLSLNPILTHVSGHFINFNIEKTKDKIKFEEEKTQQEYTKNPSFKREVIKGGLFDSKKELGVLTRQLYDLFFEKTKDKSYSDQKSGMAAAFLLTNALYLIQNNAETSEQYIGQLIKKGKAIKNSSYKIFSINKEITLSATNQNKTRLQ